MSQRRNKALIQLMDGSYEGETSRVNVKHGLLDDEDVILVAFVMTHLNSRKSRGKVKTC